VTDPKTGESDNKLVPVVNGKYLSNGEYMDEPNLNDNGEPTTLVALKYGDYTLHGEKPDNYVNEGQLMNTYYQNMTNSDTWTEYPSTSATLRCALIDCSGKNQIYNSNSYYHDAQIKAGQEISSINENVLLPGYPGYVPVLGPTPDIGSAESAMMSR
jgi:hypothetical protein|tara:strand:+ start:239 stop:709 length:471 start_codon:yes stop_codon:yes gene_type:complete